MAGTSSLVYAIRRLNKVDFLQVPKQVVKAPKQIYGSTIPYDDAVSVVNFGGFCYCSCCALRCNSTFRPIYSPSGIPYPGYIIGVTVFARGEKWAVAPRVSCFSSAPFSINGNPHFAAICLGWLVVSFLYPSVYMKLYNCYTVQLFKCHGFGSHQAGTRSCSSSIYRTVYRALYIRIVGFF